MSGKIENLERINSIRETNGRFWSCNSCKRLVTSRLHDLHESKLPFVSRIEFIRSEFLDFSAHVSGFGVSAVLAARPLGWQRRGGGVQTDGASPYCQHTYCMYMGTALTRWNTHTRHSDSPWSRTPLHLSPPRPPFPVLSAPSLYMSLRVRPLWLMETGVCFDFVDFIFFALTSWSLKWHDF